MSALFRSTSTNTFDKLYREHAASIYRYTRAVLGNHSDAEDVTQQVFLKAYRALEQGTKPRKAENWLFTIAHNEVRRHLRDTRGKRLEVELDEELARPVPERTEPSVTDVLRALQHLTPNQRSALVMREFEGRSYAEISQIMGVSQAALETLVFRARRALAEALEDGLTCEEAELAVSRRLDGRLPRREARRLKAHMRECRLCSGFERRQKHQRSLLRGLSVIPVPVSLFAFRGEAASAAGALATGATATGVSTGVAAKAAAVVAAVTVAGGVGYTAGAESPRVPARESKVAQAAAPGRATAAPAGVRRAARAQVAVSAPTGRSPEATRAQAAKKPKKAKALPARAREVRKAAKVSGPVERAAPPKSQPAKKAPAPKRTKPEKKAKPANAVEHPLAQPAKRPQPKPKKAEKPEKAARPVVPAPAPALPPGQARRGLDPKPEKTKP